MCLKKWVDKCGSSLYLLFRLLVGFFIFSHGLGKMVPGFLGPGDITAFAGLVWGQTWLAYAVAIAEVLAGVGIFLGLFTRPAALVGSAVMLGALVFVHFAKNVNLLANGSELAFMYLGAFLVLFVHGAGKWALEKKLFSKECFWN